jgi:hypothetical protein
MKKIVILVLLSFFNVISVFSQSNTCASATSLTVGAALNCGQTTNGANIQAGECVYPGGGGMSEQTVWYRFTASNDSLVLNYLRTNTATFVSYVTVYGPFASGGGCLPACTNTVYTAVQSGDPGSHILLTGLATSGNRDYLIQIQGFSGGGAGDPYVNFCINIANPAANSAAPSNASIINNCGVTYNGTTNGGYWASGTSAGFNNLDANNGTTVGGASETGDDVTFVINNISWFKFCSVNAGTYNVQFDVISCAFTGPNSGSQMAILTGTNTSLTNIWQATNPTYTNTAVQTSPNFALAAGGCAYLVVDGFAGDACSYSYVLTNVAGGCILLPIELMSFDAVAKTDVVDITWVTASEKNNDFFTVERSKNGIDFETLKTIKGAENSTSMKNYFVVDNNPLAGLSYYRLKQTDLDGKYTYSEIRSVNFENETKFEMTVFPNPIQENNSVFVSINSSKNDKIALTITDIAGQVLAEKDLKLENSSATIEVKHSFHPGIYFVKVVNHDGEAVFKKLIVR